MPPKDSTFEPYAGPPFAHDVFVSYSHGPRADDGEDSPLRAWTNEFVSRLKTNVDLAVEDQTRQVSIWHDSDLARNVKLTDAIKDKVVGSATLVIVMTPRFLQSAWCKQEVEWFRREIERRGAGTENVFLVRAMPTDRAEWPDFLMDDHGESVLGYSFCNKAEGPYPHGWPSPKDSDTAREYFSALTQLAADIARKLDEMRSSTRQPAPTGDRRQKKEWRVFIAPPTDDVRPVSLQIREALSGKDCELCPAADIKLDQFSDEVLESDLGLAQAFVQCIGFTPARDEEREIGMVQFLNQTAREREIPQFLFRDRTIPVEALGYDRVYREFVESLGDRPVSSVDQIVESVIKHLEVAEPENQILAAFIEVPAEALERFEELRESIRTEECALFPLRPPGKGRMQDIQGERRARRHFYRSCNVVLLVYCVPNQEEWLSEAIVDHEKYTTAVKRQHGSVPDLVIVDLIGEALPVAETVGVAAVRWRADSDPAQLWAEIRTHIR